MTARPRRACTAGVRPRVSGRTARTSAARRPRSRRRAPPKRLARRRGAASLHSSGYRCNKMITRAHELCDGGPVIGRRGGLLSPAVDGSAAELSKERAARTSPRLVTEGPARAERDTRACTRSCEAGGNARARGLVIFFARAARHSAGACRPGTRGGDLGSVQAMPQGACVAAVKCSLPPAAAQGPPRAAAPGVRVTAGLCRRGGPARAPLTGALCCRRGAGSAEGRELTPRTRPLVRCPALRIGRAWVSRAGPPVAVEATLR